MADRLRAELVVDALQTDPDAAGPTAAWCISPTKAARADSTGRRNTH
jgi:hypothetical protein